MDRRRFLRGLGTVTIVVLGGTVWYADEEGAFSQGRGPAFAPWSDWNQPQTGMLALVRAGILAASPHNTQPWLFRVHDNQIEVFADTSRNTGGLDPFLRELHIGMGCALENMDIASHTAGYAADITLADGAITSHDETSTRHRVATVSCTAASLPGHPLYAMLPERHTNRMPYEMRALSASFQRELLAMPQSLPDTKLFLFTAEDERQAIVELISQCDETVYKDKAVGAGTVPWERVFRWKDVEQQRDGITLADYGVPAKTAALLYCLPIPVEMAVMARTAKDVYPKQLTASPMFGIIAVRDRYSVSQCLQAGRLWERAHLLATADGISARPVNEVIELIDIEKAEGRPSVTEPKLNAIIGEAGWQPTFMFRMGYAAKHAPASPRRSLAQVLLQ
jgi:nitroreductase